MPIVNLYTCGHYGFTGDGDPRSNALGVMSLDVACHDCFVQNKMPGTWTEPKFDLTGEVVETAIGKASTEAQPVGDLGAVRVPVPERFDLIPLNGLQRLSLIFAEGARPKSEGGAGYGEHNYRKGILFSNLWNHIVRHMWLRASGDRSEDHLAKGAWGFHAMMEIEREHPECDDLRWNEPPKT